jgi:hypothetical protein
MMPEPFAETLLYFLGRRPFRPFVIELNTGTRLPLLYPEAITFRRPFAIYTNPLSFLREVFDATSVLRICELPRRNPSAQ